MAGPADCSIRHAVADDAAALSMLYRQLVGRQDICVAPERIADLADDARSALLVCTSGTAVYGTVLIGLCADVMFQRQPFAVVENLVVSDSMQGRGIGSLLLRAVEAFCGRRDCSKIMLLSSAHREQAHGFFERAGFLGSAKRGFVKYRRDFTASS